MTATDTIIVYACVGGGIGLIVVVAVVLLCRRYYRCCGYPTANDDVEDPAAQRGSTNYSRGDAAGSSALLSRTKRDVDGDGDTSTLAGEAAKRRQHRSTSGGGGGDLADYLQNLVDGMRVERDQSGSNARHHQQSTASRPPLVIPRGASSAALATAHNSVAGGGGGGAALLLRSGGGGGGDETSLLTLVPSNRSHAMLGGSPSAHSPMGGGSLAGASGTNRDLLQRSSNLILGFDAAGTPTRVSSVANHLDAAADGAPALSEEKVRGIERWQDHVIAEHRRWMHVGLDDPSAATPTSTASLQQQPSAVSPGDVSFATSLLAE